MVTVGALSGLIQQIPSLGGFALAALALILSPVPVVWVSFHRRRVLLARVEKDRFQAQCDQETRIGALEKQHTQRMYELETARKLTLWEQERLDRVFDVELNFLTQLLHRMKAEADSETPALPAAAHQTSAPAQGEKRAA